MMKQRNRLINCTATILILLAFQGYSQQGPAPLHLRTDLLLHTEQVSNNGLSVSIPLDSAIQYPEIYQFARIFSPQPQFSWELDTALKRARAYRILLASSPRLLQQNQADYWDSQKVKSAQAQVTYRGKPLPPGKVYHWKIQIWNDKNQPSAFSPIASFYLSAPDPAEQFAHHPLVAEIQKSVALLKRAPGRNRRLCVQSLQLSGQCLLSQFVVDGKKTSLVPQAGFYLLKNLQSGKHVLTTQ